MSIVEVLAGAGYEFRMLRGSCLCERIKFQLTAAPESMHYCHCSMCRRATGTAFATNLLIRATDFEFVSGREFLKGFESSVGEVRYFCSECGSPIYSEAESRKGRLSVRCGTLLDDPGLRPTRHFFASSKAPWFEICDHLPRVEPGR